MFKKLLILTLALCMASCSNFFDKDNTPEPKPLVSIKPEVNPHLLWSARAGSGSNSEQLRLPPAVGEQAIYTSSVDGTVTSVNKANGRVNWQTNSGIYVSSGPGAGDGIVVVGGRHGRVAALSAANGSVRWRSAVSGEILASPVIRDGVVLIKAVSGYVNALSTTDGHTMWSFQQAEPALLLRGASAPLIQDRNAFIGFANGNLAKIKLYDGQLLWMRPIATAQGAFAIQRMIDIDANPVIYEHNVYAATYQGNIQSLDWSTGHTLWSHDISSYTGMVANDDAVYITDASGYVWAFGSNNGLVNWRQTDLEFRILSGPAVMGNYVVVGDAEGYLHWLDRHDGHFAAREYAGGAISANPIVENGVLYALTNNGNLVAYTI
jgi:outer membrane protein assembly factor BamB